MIGQLTIELHQQRLFENSCQDFYAKYPGTEAINTAGRAVLCRALKEAYGVDTLVASLPELMGWFEQMEARARERVRFGARVRAEATA